jgi:hypothetical protein
MSGLLVVINEILINQMKLGAIQGPDWLDIKSPAYFDQDQGQPNLACLMNKKDALSKS